MQLRYKVFIVVLGVILLGGARLAVEMRSDAYRAATAALYSSPAVLEAVGGKINGITLVGLGNKIRSEISDGSRQIQSCGTRRFVVRGESLVFVEVGLQKKSAAWDVTEVLVGWDQMSTDRCSFAE